MFNVYVVNTITFKATHLIGQHLDRMASELCEYLWKTKIDRIDHTIVRVEEGSERDISLLYNLMK